jgi:hypothetical protein
MEIECGVRVLGAAEGWPRPHLLGVSMWRYLSVGWVVAAQRPIRTPAEVTKHTYEVMGDFENSNHGNRVR